MSIQRKFSLLFAVFSIVSATTSQAAAQAINFQNPNYDLINREIIKATNAARAQNGRRPFAYSKQLTQAAQDHCNDMVNKNFYSHENPHDLARKTPTQRINQTGYKLGAMGENIADSFGIQYVASTPYFSGPAGSGEIKVNDSVIPPHTAATLAKSLVDSWMNSPGHRKNILSPTTTEMGAGVAFYRNAGKLNNAYLVKACQVFASPAAGSSGNPAAPAGQPMVGQPQPGGQPAGPSAPGQPGTDSPLNGGNSSATGKPLSPSSMAKMIAAATDPGKGEYQLVYAADLAKLGNGFAYDQNNSGKFSGGFDRIGYLLELKGAIDQSVFVSMNAFTNDATKIGIPMFESGASFQQDVKSMNVYSTVDGINGMGSGSIEFWPNDYKEGANGVFDSKDEKTGRDRGHGSMQVHNQSGKTIFALNGWLAGQRADLGIGNGSPNSDWTLAANASKYSVKRLRVYVRPLGSGGTTPAAVANSAGNSATKSRSNLKYWFSWVNLNGQTYISNAYGNKADAVADLTKQVLGKSRRLYPNTARYSNREEAMKAARAAGPSVSN